MAKTQRFHRDRKVRWRSIQKCWVITIGRTLTSSNKLVDKDWYFSGHLSEDAANKLANQKSQQWEKVCRNWPKSEQPLHEAFGVN